MLNLDSRQEPIPAYITCKSCGSRRLYRHGHSRGKDRYRCRDCGVTFLDTPTLPRMRVPASLVGSALRMFYSGMSLDDVGDQLGGGLDFNVHGSTVHKWVVRFSQVAVKAVEGARPSVGDVWMADETVLKICRKNTRFWDVMDDRTRFLLASHLAVSRNVRDARILMARAAGLAGKVPATVVTENLVPYLDGIELAAGADTRRVQSRGFTIQPNTKLMDRFRWAIEERTRVMRGMQNPVTANLVMEGWWVHYNFIREHAGLGGRTPAEVAGVEVPFRSWEGVVMLEGRV